MDTATATAIAAIATSVCGVAGSWVAQHAKQREQERHEQERFAAFMRGAFEREQKASDECEQRRMRDEQKHNLEMHEVTGRLHAVEMELARLKVEHARCPGDIARLRAQMMQVLRTTPTNAEWDRAIAENPDMWQSIREGSK